jgi:hypothetical protein
MLAIELQGLVDFGFDVLLTGFEPAEVDIIIEGIGDESEQPENLVPEQSAGPPVSRLGDVWMLGKHILVRGDSTDAATYKLLMDDDKAEFIFTDPPYNVKIDGNVSGLGRIKHREFATAFGEMSEGQFTAFLSSTYDLLCKYSTDGSIHQICIDWRHMREMFAAGDANYAELKNERRRCEQHPITSYCRRCRFGYCSRFLQWSSVAGRCLDRRRDAAL